MNSPQFVDMWEFFTHSLEDLIDVIYPRSCGTCDHYVPMRKSPFCVRCLSELPYTGYHALADNPFERQFWGRIKVVAGAAMLYFIPGGTTQRLLHNIKYGGKKDLAVRIGEIYAADLKTSRFGDIDLIVPVPLHWKKKYRRGYNQSEALALGLSNGLGVPVLTRVLKRMKAGSSLTSLSRVERLEAVEQIFAIDNPEGVAGKRVLLVDDVLTTGATLEVCAKLLLKAGATVSLCTLACGRI